MNISHRWLFSHINTTLTIDETSTILTELGLEVEGVNTYESLKGGLKGIVVGEVLTKEKHPDADKLSITTVDIGEDAPFQIVCGAPNVAVGQKVAVATLGSTVYPLTGEAFTIKKSKIRGVESTGMLCAEDELGLSNAHDGILILDSELKIGTPLSEVYDVFEDAIYEIGLTPNRSDATSHIGVAKDLVAYLKIHKSESVSFKNETYTLPSKKETLDISIKVEDQERCPRYAGIVLSNIVIKESPAWLKGRLQSIGVKAINNVVDITNFILHEYGQPLHAFDYDIIKNHTVNVTCLADKTPFVTLDGNTIELKGTDLMICDGNHTPMCLAGVYGGLESGVKSTTHAVFLESAYFTASTVRKSSMHHLLRTDAAKCFEKGSDPSVVVEALTAAVHLLVDIAGATVASQLIDIYPTPVDSQPILLSQKNIARIIGVDIPLAEIKNILQALEITILKEEEGVLTVKVPTNKADVLREADVIEEILRVYGLNNIPIPTQLKSSPSVQEKVDSYSLKNKTSEYLIANGFSQIMAMSLTQSKYHTQIFNDEQSLVYINNTANMHLDIMRPNMAYGILDAIQHNINRRQKDLKFFEFGYTYEQKDGQYLENQQLAICITGNVNQESWLEKNKLSDYFHMKTYVENIFKLLGQEIQIVKQTDTDLMYEFAVSILDEKGNALGEFGSLSKNVLKTFDIKQAVYLGTVQWDRVLKKLANKKIFYKAVSKYPEVRRDLALVLDKNVDFASIQLIARRVGKKTLTDIQLFNTFESEEHLGAGKKSYAVSFTFQDSEKTLSDKDIDKLMSQLMQQYETQLNALIRK